MIDPSLRTGAKYWGVWPTIWLSAAAFLIYLIGQYLVMLAALPPIAHLSEEESSKLIETVTANGTIVSLAAIFATFCGCAAVAFAIKLKQGANWREYLGLDTVAPPAVLRWLVIGIVFLGLMDLLTVALDRELVTQHLKKIYATSHPVWLIWIVLVAISPIFEEVLFRGFLFRGLSASWLASSGAIFVSASVWGVLHWQFGFYAVAQMFAFGIFLGLARVRTGSLHAPLQIHALANFISLVETAIASPSS